MTRNVLELAPVLRQEAAHRLSLLLDKRPDDVRGPSVSRLLGELSTYRDSFVAPHWTPQPALRPRTVMLLPGFLTHPVRMRFLRRGLRLAGHEVHDWGHGFNLGPSTDRLDSVSDRVRALSQRGSGKVALLGWSLGGLYAREIAWRVPDSVDLVITMGAPFSGDRRANNAWRLYQAVAGHRVHEAPATRDPSVKPPVPTIAMWSPRDGIVSPRSARGRPGERDEAVALRCTHLGFAYSTESLQAVLDLLDRY